MKRAIQPMNGVIGLGQFDRPIMRSQVRVQPVSLGPIAVFVNSVVKHHLKDPTRMNREIVAKMAIVLALLEQCSGCLDRPSAIKVPSMDAAACGDSALKEFDANKDSYIAASELEMCPGLKAGLAVIDTNKDQRVTADEIAERVRTYQKRGIGLQVLSGNVMLDGKPLQGAIVTFVPEKFMGGDLKPAAGKSDAVGHFEIRTEGMDVPGIQPGIFRITVSRKNAEGAETIPARYNTESTLGEEIGKGSRLWIEGVELRLSSKK